MRLYIYHGLDNEKVPEDITHAIIKESVTTIKAKAFKDCLFLVSVVMGDNVERIEMQAFRCCVSLRFIRLSKTLECIEREAFAACGILEALFIPSTVKSIGDFAFYLCRSLRLLILPNGLDLHYVGLLGIAKETAIWQIAETAVVGYRVDDISTFDIDRRVTEWLIHYMDEASFHKLCYNSSVNTHKINDYLNENGINTSLQIDSIHGMTPLHMLSMNPHAPATSIAALLNSNMKAVFCLDNHQKNPLQYARDYNVGGLVGIISCLCNYRNSSILVELETNNDNAM